PTVITVAGPAGSRVALETSHRTRPTGTTTSNRTIPMMTSSAPPTFTTRSSRSTRVRGTQSQNEHHAEDRQSDGDPPEDGAGQRHAPTVETRVPLHLAQAHVTEHHG